MLTSHRHGVSAAFTFACTTSATSAGESAVCTSVWGEYVTHELLAGGHTDQSGKYGRSLCCRDQRFIRSYVLAIAESPLNLVQQL